jgi:hypothetical protein
MKKLLIIAVLVLASVFFLGSSENSRLPQLSYEEKPYYIGDNELIATIGGLPLYFDEFRYHAYTILDELGLDPETADWDYTEGLTDEVIDGAIKKAARWRVTELASKDAGIEADESAVMANAAAVSGDWVTRRVAINSARAYVLGKLLFTDKYGPFGNRLSDDDAYIFGAESGIIRVKSLYFSTTTPLITEKEINAKREQASIFASEIKSGYASFDDIMRVYGEAEADTDGYQFSSGGISGELYSAASSLAIGESGGVVEVKDDGLYILMRLELQLDDTVNGMMGTLRYNAASSLYNKYIDSLCEKAVIVYEDAYERINPSLCFRASL